MSLSSPRCSTCGDKGLVAVWSGPYDYHHEPCPKFCTLPLRERIFGIERCWWCGKHEARTGWDEAGFRVCSHCVAININYPGHGILTEDWTWNPRESAKWWARRYAQLGRRALWPLVRWSFDKSLLRAPEEWPNG